MNLHYLVEILYIISFSLFIYGLMGLTGPKTAVRGNLIAAAGMTIAVAATLVMIRHTSQWPLIIAGLVVGVVLGAAGATDQDDRHAAAGGILQRRGRRNGRTHRAVGVHRYHRLFRIPARRVADRAHRGGLIVRRDHRVDLVLGSIVAFGKLQEIISGRPIGLGKAQQPINLLLLAVAVAAAVVIGLHAHPGSGGVALWWMIGLLVAAGVLGLMVVLPIGGADMPVVISMLNAMTGLSAAAAGLALNNTAMIVAGMIVGASGSILTNLMAKAMNRSIPAIVAGGFGGGGVAPSGGGDDKHVKATSAADAAIQMAYANQVIVVPGYGLAVAQAQHAVKDLATLLEDRGVPVKYAIHPVAGRMPGHMNVLLAEAEVDYDAMKDMDDINDEFARTDVTIVIGANDVTNPAARNETSSPIYGMPILNVDKSRSVIVLKRSMNSGFAGIDNPLFYADGTTMLFGDAKKSVTEVSEELKAL